MQLIESNSIKFSPQENIIKDKLYLSINQENAIAIAIVDEELRFVTANTAFCRLLEIPEGNYLNNRHISILPFSKDSSFNYLIEGLVTNRLPKFEIDTSFNALKNNSKFLKLKMNSFKEEGIFSGGVLYLEDITQIKEKIILLEKNNKVLKQKNKILTKQISSKLQLENFAHLVAHDMQEPLRMIGSFSQLLEKRYKNHLDESAKEYLSFIVGGVNNLNELIHGLLSYSILDKVEHKVIALNPKNINFMISSILHKKLEEKNIRFSIESMPDIIYGVKNKINLLFTHLITNAIKFSRKEIDSFIKIRGWAEADCWKFELEDNGIGIEEGYNETIFLLFKRLHPKNEYSGSGIGLAICKKVVEQHGGKLSVKSKVGRGSTFTFSISKNIN